MCLQLIYNLLCLSVNKLVTEHVINVACIYIDEFSVLYHYVVFKENIKHCSLWWEYKKKLFSYPLQSARSQQRAQQAVSFLFACLQSRHPRVLGQSSKKVIQWRIGMPYTGGCMFLCRTYCLTIKCCSPPFGMIILICNSENRWVIELVFQLSSK